MSETSVVEARVAKFYESLTCDPTKTFTVVNSKNHVDDIITTLKSREDDFTTEDIGDALTTLHILPDACLAQTFSMQERSSYKKELANYLSEKEYAELFLKIAASLQVYITTEKYDEESQPVYNLSVLFSGFWNQSDESMVLAEQFGENEGVELMMQFIHLLDEGIQHTELSTTRDVKLELLRKIYAVLHNCSRHNHSNRHYYRKANAVAFFESKTRSPDVNIRIDSVLILAHIDARVTERVAPHLDCVLLLVELLRRALESNTHILRVTSESSEGCRYSALELANALCCLAVNDDNKVAIQLWEGIPVIVKMLQDHLSEDEIFVAFDLIRHLVFIDGIKRDEVIQDIKDLFGIMMESGSFFIKEIASHILWEMSDYEVSFPSNVEDPTNETPYYLTAPRSEAAEAPGQCIKISFQQDWNARSRALYIKDKLMQEGYNVWMNEYPLRERLLAETTATLKRSVVLLICANEEYKESPSCRSEASYAKKLGIPLIPLLMDSEYQPDGWLEKLLGTNTKYHRFCIDEDMDTSFAGLVDELGDRGKARAVRVLGKRLKATMQKIKLKIGKSEKEDSQTSSNRKETFSVASDRNVRYWSSKRVQMWLKENGLEKVCFPANLCQGNQLLQMYEHYCKDGDKLKDALKTDLELDATTVLNFTSALCKLLK